MQGGVEAWDLLKWLARVAIPVVDSEMRTSVASFPAQLCLFGLDVNAVLCESGRVVASPGLMEFLHYLLTVKVVQVVIPAGGSEMITVALFQPQLCSLVVGATAVVCKLEILVASSQLMEPLPFHS